MRGSLPNFADNAMPSRLGCCGPKSQNGLDFVSVSP